MKYLNMIFEKIVRLNNSHFENYILEKEFSVATIRCDRGY